MMPPRILVADDDPAFRAALGDILDQIGCAATLVGGAAEALSAVRANPPDLVILDHMMPPATGLAVLDALQADPCLRRIPVIFITATPDMIPARPGVAAVLGKPFRLDHLVERLRSILEGRLPQ